VSRYGHDGQRLARARLLVRYTEAFDDDVLAALRYLHRRQGW
jgi:hypothetical protein